MCYIIDELCKVLIIMRVTPVEKADFPLINLSVFLKFDSTNILERGWLMLILLIGEV